MSSSEVSSTAASSVPDTPRVSPLQMRRMAEAEEKKRKAAEAKVSVETRPKLRLTWNTALLARTGRRPRVR